MINSSFFPFLLLLLSSSPLPTSSFSSLPLSLSFLPSPKSSSSPLSPLFSTPRLTFYDVIRLKEQEFSAFRKAHSSPEDPLQVMLGYFEAEPDFSRFKKLARATRRLSELDPAASPMHDPRNTNRLLSVGLDLKRSTPSSPTFSCAFDSAGSVAASLSSVVDFVFVNADYRHYGGDVEDVKETVNALKDTGVPVIFKDLVIDPLQLALAKSLGCDGMLVIAGVLGPDLTELLNTATLLNFPIIVECHTPEEVTVAVEAGASYILVNRRDRLTNEIHLAQPFAVRDLLPPGNVLTILATGGVETPEECRELLDAGYDGVVMGQALVGNPKAHAKVREVKELEIGEGADFLNMY